MHFNWQDIRLSQFHYVPSCISSHEELQTAETPDLLKSPPPEAAITHFQLCRIGVYRFALTVFGQGGRSNCRNDIEENNRVQRGRESEV